MARHQSAIKAARQAVKRTARNQAAISRVRTTVKKLRAAVTAAASGKGDKKALAPLLNDLQRTLMKAASKKLIKRETASRQISRLSAAVHRATA
jgi:small subunit ribosomal protein S20